MITGVRTRAAEREDQLLHILIERAAAGRVCPTNGELCELLGMDSVGATSGIMSRLERRGFIRVERGNTSRVVTIAASGQRTAGEVKTPHWSSIRKRRPSQKRTEAGVVELEPSINRPRVNRDPCPRCGVRRDIGCSHSQTRLGMML